MHCFCGSLYLLCYAVFCSVSARQYAHRTAPHPPVEMLEKKGKAGGGKAGSGPGGSGPGGKQKLVIVDTPEPTKKSGGCC